MNTNLRVEAPRPGLARGVRVFLGDGFHARARRPDGAPALDGYLIQISSGAFMLGGYPPLSDGAALGDR